MQCRKKMELDDCKNYSYVCDLEVPLLLLLFHWALSLNSHS